MDDKYYIKLNKETGLLIFWSTRQYTFEGTYEQVLKEFNKVQRHNHIWGWWSGLGPLKVRKWSKANKNSIKIIQDIRRKEGLAI